MTYNESNFIYLKSTSLEKYYYELLKSEYICEYFPVVTKILVRKVMESLLKYIAEKYNIENNVPARNLLNNIKNSLDFSFPEEIYKAIEIILDNGYEYSSRNNKNIPKNSIEILEVMHNILCWYLKNTEPQRMLLIKDLSFKAPSTIEYQEKEVNRIKSDLLLKENQINNLRQKIIELGSNQAKSIMELNKIIMAIKEERIPLEEAQRLLTKKIQMQKKQVEDTEKNYKMYIKKLDKLEELCDENQKLLFEKESQLVKVEIEKQELKNLVRKLDEKDEAIERREQYLEEELKLLRQTYENILNLTNQYHDILETIEFSTDEELHKILDIQKNNIKVEINFEDGIFSEKMLNYNQNVDEAKRKVIVFKEILNEKIKREIKYKPFYRGFLRLEGKQLRILYSIINYLNMTSNLMGKPKELLSKSNKDKFIELINKNLNELKNVSDDEIKLILYYKLIKLSKIRVRSLYNRKQFINMLDSIVDKAYEVLVNKDEFKGTIKKLDAISSYYLEKIVSALKSTGSNVQLSEDLIDTIYKRIIELKETIGNIESMYPDKLNLDNISEETIKATIRSQPFNFLLIIADFIDINSYKEIAIMIFEIENLIEKRTLAKNGEEGYSVTKFSNEYFIMLLFLSSGAIGLSKKQQVELVPLLVIEIMSIDLIAEDDFVNLDSYNGMINLWKRKQQKYNDIFIKKEDKNDELESLLKDKKELEFKQEELIRTHVTLINNYKNYNEEFKKIVLNSDKSVLLPSYIKYDELRSKMKVTENNINDSKNKLGTLKSMLSPELWKEQASKFINESTMLELEKKLIEEAKQKPYFNKDYKVFSELKEKIDEINKSIDANKQNLKEKSLLIEDMQVKVNELQKQLSNIKDIYLDIEEGYY